MKKYSLFLGCMIPQRIPSMEIAARRVFERAGAEHGNRGEEGIRARRS